MPMDDVGGFPCDAAECIFSTRTEVSGRSREKLNIENTMLCPLERQKMKMIC